MHFEKDSLIKIFLKRKKETFAHNFSILPQFSDLDAHFFH